MMKKIYNAPNFKLLTVAKEDVLNASGELTYTDKQDNITPDDFPAL